MNHEILDQLHDISKQCKKVKLKIPRFITPTNIRSEVPQNDYQSSQTGMDYSDQSWNINKSSEIRKKIRKNNSQDIKRNNLYLSFENKKNSSIQKLDRKLILPVR